MPIRFSTEAANADRMVDDSLPDRDTPGDTPEEKKRPTATSEGKPGKDINAAGFVRDKDNGSP